MGPGSRHQPHVAAVEPCMHAVAVEFDFMQPLIAFRRGVDQLGQLRRDRLRQSGRARETRHRPRHAGSGNRLLSRRMRLLEVVDLADVLGGMGEFESDAPAMCCPLCIRALTLGPPHAVVVLAKGMSILLNVVRTHEGGTNEVIGYCFYEEIQVVWMPEWPGIEGMRAAIKD